MKILYTTIATATGGRKGTTKSSDGKLDLALSMPKGMGGDDGPGTNPEQLFACAYAACFNNALNLVSRFKRMNIESSSVTANVDIGSNPDRTYGLAVQLHVNIPGIEQATAESLTADAHKVCPFSNATKGNVQVDFIVTV